MKTERYRRICSGNATSSCAELVARRPRSRISAGSGGSLPSTVASESFRSSTAAITRLVTMPPTSARLPGSR